jgi:hypothetical protein
METSLLDLAGTLVAVVLTLFVFSYLLGDNFLFRLAEHMFIGVAVGYAVVIAFHSVLAPKLLTPLVQLLGAGNWGGVALMLIPLIFGLFLLTKPIRRLSWLGSLSVALLLGVGAALAIGGALLGTLLPQVSATADISRYLNRYGPGLGLISAVVIILGTIGVLLRFHFSAGGDGRLTQLRDRVVQTWGGLGQWFILIAFGTILATTFMSRMSLLAGRVQFLWDSVRNLIEGLGG